jgi:hypothetical protein
MDDPTAWQAGEETLTEPGMSVRQYICLGAPANMTASVGKAVYGYGCYVPRGSGPYKDTTDIQILGSRADPPCLDWAPLVSGELPTNVLRLGPAGNSVPVCRAAYSQLTPDGLMSNGTHVGEAVPVGSSYNCRFEFYDRLVTLSDFTVLVRVSR